VSTEWEPELPRVMRCGLAEVFLVGDTPDVTTVLVYGPETMRDSAFNPLHDGRAWWCECGRSVGACKHIAEVARERRLEHPGDCYPGCCHGWTEDQERAYRESGDDTEDDRR
jgi:hypothetical protein